jgi:hypothetical protein
MHRERRAEWFEDAERQIEGLRKALSIGVAPGCASAGRVHSFRPRAWRKSLRSRKSALERGASGDAPRGTGAPGLDQKGRRRGVANQERVRDRPRGRRCRTPHPHGRSVPGRVGQRAFRDARLRRLHSGERMHRERRAEWFENAERQIEGLRKALSIGVAPGCASAGRVHSSGPGAWRKSLRSRKRSLERGAREGTFHVEHERLA